MKPIIWSWFAPDLFQKRGPKNSALPKNLFKNAEVNKLFEEKKIPLLHVYVPLAIFLTARCFISDFCSHRNRTEHHTQGGGARGT